MQSDPLGERLSQAPSNEISATPSQAAAPSVAHAVYLAGPAVRTLAVDASDGVLRRERSAPNEDGRWQDVVALATGIGEPFTPIRVAEFGFDDTGGVLLYRTDNTERGVRTVFDPPLLVCPATLDIDATHTHETQLTTTTQRGEGDAREQAGTVRVETTRSAPERVETAAGPVDAQRLDVRLVLTIDNAEVTRSTRYAFTFADGVLVDDSAERVRALGFTVRNERRVARVIADGRTD